MGDDGELVEQLKRVQSDVGFRNWTRHRMLLVVVLVVFDLLVSVLSVTAIVLIRNRDDERSADLAAARRAGCIQFDINQKNTREAIIGGLVETFRPLVQPGHEADLDQFATSLRTNVEALLPYRDCSDRGIEAFLKSPPTDPATGG